MRCQAASSPVVTVVVACISCRDENAHMMRCQPHRYVHLLPHTRKELATDIESIKKKIAGTE
ncbi:hypothetical protein Hanom_Chr06g00561291 [Helianthus anomalus]